MNGANELLGKSGVPMPATATADSSLTVDMLKGMFAERGIHGSVILASTFRSGSSYVASLLRKNGVAGLGPEWFNRVGKPGIEINAYLAEVLDRFRGERFPLKLMWSHRSNLARALGIGRSDVARFREVFPGAKWIHVYRDDLFAQAVSMWRATTTGQWHVNKQSDEQVPPPEYDYDGIRKQLNYLYLHNQLWSDFFDRSGISPYRVNYESFLGSDKAQQIREMLAYCGIDSTDIKLSVALKRQTDDASALYVERFLEDLYRRGD